MSDLVGNPEDRFSRDAAQIKLYNHRSRLEPLNFGFKKKRKCSIPVAKTKALISFAVTVKLICVFVFAKHVDCWFSQVAAQIIFPDLHERQ